MELILKVLSGRNAGLEIPVATSKFFIGRGNDCHLRPHSDTVSRHHCMLTIVAGNARVRDFGSRNGTFVNGERITAEVPLKPGDHLTVGNLQFQVVAPGKAIPADAAPAGLGGKKRAKVKDLQDVATRTAASATGEEELDVDNWLTAPSADPLLETAPVNPPTETRPLELTRTAEIPSEVTQAMHDSDPGSMAETIYTPANPTQAGNKHTGKLPTTPQAQSKDSREAAAEMLRKYFKRK